MAKKELMTFLLSFPPIIGNDMTLRHSEIGSSTSRNNKNVLLMFLGVAAATIAMNKPGLTKSTNE
jgi:hypothetical protein